MVNLLCRLFVRDRERVREPAVRRAYGTLVSVVGIVCNLLLFAGKFAVGTLFGAVSVLADAMNNLSDALSQGISLFSFRMGAKPADREHPFGHARMEYGASIVISILILLVGYELFQTSLTEILRPTEPTVFSLLSVWILAGSIAVKVWLWYLNRKVGKKISSQVLLASSMDCLSDVCTTAAVLVGQLLLRFAGIDVDGWLGLLVALWIVWTGIQLLRKAMNAVLGEGPSEATVNQVRQVVFSYPETLGMHDLLIHSYGAGHTLASLHVEVDGAGDIFALHEAMDNMEKRLLAEYGIQATIHMDPIVTGDAALDDLRVRVAEAVAAVDGRMRIHDFRMVRGRVRSNLIFDVAVPYECPLDDGTVRERIEAEVRKLNDGFRVTLTIDRE